MLPARRPTRTSLPGPPLWHRPGRSWASKVSVWWTERPQKARHSMPEPRPITQPKVPHFETRAVSAFVVVHGARHLSSDLCCLTHGMYSHVCRAEAATLKWQKLRQRVKKWGGTHPHELCLHAIMGSCESSSNLFDVVCQWYLTGMEAAAVQAKIYCSCTDCLNLPPPACTSNGAWIWIYRSENHEDHMLQVASKCHYEKPSCSRKQNLFWKAKSNPKEKCCK